MPDYRAPTKEQVQQVLLQIPTYQLRRVFYEGLKNPLWVRPLMEAGAFASPPEPVQTPDGLIQDTFWPEVTYLNAVAKDVPSDVVDVLLDVANTKNAWVKRAAIEIAVKLPIDEAKRLVPMFKDWAKSGDFGWRTDPSAQVSLAVYLLENGASGAGKWMANILFAPRETEEKNRQPTFGLQDYWYETELTRIVKPLGTSALPQLAGWLERYIDSSPWFRSHDFSANERTAIAQLSDGEHLDPKHALIDAVRDSALDLAISDPAKVAKVLQGSSRQLLLKIALYVFAESLRRAAEAGASSDQLVAAAMPMLDASDAYDENLRVDYARLARALKAAGVDVAPAVRQFLHAAYESDVEWMTDRLPRDDRDDAQFEDEVKGRSDRNRHRWLASLGNDVLDADLVRELADFDAQDGAVSDPLEPRSKVTSWTGPNAFSSKAHMEKMSPADLVAYLSQLHDTGDGWGPEPSHEGQGRELSALLTTTPLAVSGARDLVGVLRPTYLRAILQGWGSAYKAGLALDWSQVVDLLTDVLNHDDASEFEVEGGNFDDDADMRDAKKAAVDLLESLLQDRDDVVVPVSMVSKFAELLLANAPGTTAWTEYDGYDHDSSWDPLNASLNWAWPKRVRALLVLATRVGENPWRDRALAELDVELDRGDAHGASWAVVGEFLGRLMTNCADWLDSRLDRFIGTVDGVTAAQQVVLTTAIIVHRYNRMMYMRMQGAMIAALRVGDDLRSGWQSTEEALERIGTWVVDAWVYGHIDDKDPLFQEFLGRMPPALRGKSLGSIAWSFLRAESADKAIVERFNALWDQRLAHVREVPEDSGELSGFLWLAKSAHHEASWWLPRLRDALALEPSIASERYMIGKEIALASISDPRNALAVTKLLIGQNPSGMVAHDLSRHAIPTVIANAIRSGDQDLATEAKAFMNELGAGGYQSLESEVTDVLDGRITPDDVE